MKFLANIKSEKELIREFKRLAHVCHPDKGGNVELMQQLNEEYRAMKTFFNASGHDFSSIRVGDTVFVNGTECQVTHVSAHAFIAKAKLRNKSAVFDKKSGMAVGNRKYRASLY
jgi:hypothetical protein